MSFLTAFQSYQNNVRIITKGCNAMELVYGQKISASGKPGGSNLGSLDQYARA